MIQAAKVGQDLQMLSEKSGHTPQELVLAAVTAKIEDWKADSYLLMKDLSSALDDVVQ